MQRSRLDQEKTLLWTYTPVTYGLEKSFPTVYHCVDLLGAFPRVDSHVIERGENQLARAGAAAAATSRVVLDHLTELGFKNVEYWPNVADVEVIESALTGAKERSPSRVIFCGNLTTVKVDYGVLRELSQMGLDVVVAGPVAEGGGADPRAFRELLASGVRHLGNLDPQQLALEMNRSMVGLIPYLVNDYTHGVSPLKTYEYLAAGLPVVSTDLPGVDPDGRHIWKEVTQSAFITRVLQLSAALTQEAIEERVQLARGHSWQARGVEARALMERGLAR